MADDRLDDAIDAVVRAVDRIERATRPPAAGGDPAMPVSPGPIEDATRPIPGSIGSAGSVWAPRTPATSAPPSIPAPQSTAEFSALGAQHLGATGSGEASPEVHELVGRIVGGMQALDDHLTAATRLRGEISQLVARLASVAGRPSR